MCSAMFKECINGFATNILYYFFLIAYVTPSTARYLSDTTRCGLFLPISFQRSARPVYKTFVCINDSEVTRTSEYRKRNTTTKLFCVVSMVTGIWMCFVAFTVTALIWIRVYL